MATNEHFKVDLRGIIDLAANHLYSSPDVFVREVIQNAVDAITARRRFEPALVGSVRLELTSAQDAPSTLCVGDDGIGLSLAEVHEFLSTVGGSSKREDAEAAAERASEEAGSFLGRFGIGLLSCFMVTDEIVVVTRSAHHSDARPVEWRGRADGSYSVRELTDRGMLPGTRVYLRAKEDHEEFFHKDRLIELARRYAEMLSIAIIVAAGEDETRINHDCPPWDMRSDDGVALADYCQQSLGFRPIDVFRIDAPAGGVMGYGFVRPDRVARWNTSHRLYADGMFVAESPNGLIPNWANFIGCVLNSRGLRLTASREGVHKDEALTNATEQIGTAIRARFAHLLRSDPERFAAVMMVHDTEIRGLAVRDRDFFELIIDLLEFETTLGAIRFGEFWREHERLLIARTAEQYRRLSRVASAAGLRVFNGGYTYHEELLARAAERHPDLQVLTFDSADLVELLTPPGDIQEFATLLSVSDEALQSRNCQLCLRTFEPVDVPAFFALGSTAEFHRQLDLTKAMSSQLWREVLETMAPRPEEFSATRLCLNARSPLVRRLASLQDAELLRTAIEVLYVQALMGGQHALTGDELALLHRGMERLLSRVAEAEAER